jgi:hypothetical protein
MNLPLLETGVLFPCQLLLTLGLSESSMGDTKAHRAGWGDSAQHGEHGE